MIDSRQAYPQQVVVAGLRALGYAEQADNLKHFAYNVVALTPRCAAEIGYEIPAEDAKKPYVEVSGRKGQGVKADDLLDRLEASARKEVDERHAGIARARARRHRARHRHRRAALFPAALHALDHHRLRFQGRAQLRGRDRTLRAIRRRARERNRAQRRGSGSRISGAANAANLQRIESGEIDVAKFLAAPAGDDLWELILLAGSLDARVDAAVGAQEPAFLARYAFELAQAFNVFYHKHHILSEEDAEKRAFLLRLSSLVREQLVTALGLLGITAPEKM